MTTFRRVSKRLIVIVGLSALIGAGVAPAAHAGGKTTTTTKSTTKSTTTTTTDGKTDGAGRKIG